MSAALLYAGCGQPEPASNVYNANASGSGGPEISDDRIALKTRLALMADERTSGFDVEVDASNGAVTLRGNVDDDDKKAAASEIAGEVAGVRSVNNQLGVAAGSGRKVANVADEKITDSIVKAVDSDESLQGLSLMATSQAGVVTLNGTVDTGEQLLNYAKAINKIDGVKAVVTAPVTVADEKGKQ